MDVSDVNAYSAVTREYPATATGDSPNVALRSAAGVSLFAVDTIATPSALEAIREEWNELLESSDSDCFFLTWEWLSTWWKHLGETDHLRISTVRHEGELVAILPCWIRPASLMGKRPFAVLEFLGSGNAGSDYLDLFVRKNYEDGALDALIAARGHSRLPHAVLKLNNLRQGDCLAGRFANLLNCTDWAVDEAKINICPYIPLKNQTWESYMSGLGAEHRSDFRRKWKRLQRDYDVRFEPVSGADECRRSLDLLIQHHNQRWRSRGGSDAFHTPELVSFHLDVSLSALQKGWLRLYTMYLNGQPAAFVYGFLYHRRFYFYQSAFDAAYEKYSVGMLSMGLAIKCAVEEGADEYDLLHGDEAYKSHWSRESRDLARLELYPPGLHGWLCRSAVAMGRRWRRAARSHLKEPAAA